MIHKTLNWLYRPWRGGIDGASLAVFRMGFGAILVWEVYRFLTLGRVDAYTALEYHFPWAGFAWVKPLDAEAMVVFFYGLGASAALMGVGLFFRLSAFLTFLGFTYLFLLDQSYHLNHMYLVSLLLALITVTPAATTWSLDSLRAKGPKQTKIPAWPLATLRAQLLIVFTFAGLAKINSDWLCGYPLRIWLSERSGDHLFAAVADQAAVLWFFVYGGLVGDLLFVPAILWRKTRALGLLAWVGFHLTNVVFFDIGIFPWLMLASTVLLLPPQWPRIALGRLQNLLSLPKTATGLDAPASVPSVRSTTVLFVVFWLATQIALPLRHVAYPGWVDWTEQGHNFAWRMKLRTKRGNATFQVLDPKSGERWTVNPNTYLSPSQARKLAGRPELVRLYAQHLGQRWREAGFADVEVRAEVLTSLNGRKAQLLVDPTVNLAQTPWSFGPASWIQPLSEPLPACSFEVRAGKPE